MAANNSSRRIVKAKRVLPSVPPESPRLKSVHFNSETIETSIGGTQSVGKIKQDVGKIKQDVLLHFDTPVTPSSKPGSRNAPGQTTLRNKNSQPGGNTSSAHAGKENKKVKGATGSSTAAAAVSPPESVSGETSSGASSSGESDKSSPESNSLRLQTSLTSGVNVAAISTKYGAGLEVKNKVSNSTGALFNSKQGLKSCSSNSKKVRKGYQQTSQKDSDNSSVKAASSNPAGEDLCTERTLNEKGLKESKGGGENSVEDQVTASAASGAENSGDTKSLVSSTSQHDRRTTMERVELVCQSPFRTPDSRQARRHTLESKVFSTPDCYRDVALGTPRRLLPTIHDDSVDDGVDDPEESSNCSIMVAVRVRPFVQRELSDANAQCVVSMQGNETTVTSDSGAVHRFAYDFSFWSHDRKSEDFCSQEDVYKRLAQPLLLKAFEGYNTCLFAYGQTGSGKSYCIMGHAAETGIIPRFCEELFAKADMLTSKKQVKVNVEISFFEIYNEKIHDLLAANKDKGQKKATLKVREHPVLGPYVEALSTYVVNSFEDVEVWITLGNKNRATAATGMNDKSSRSHSVFSLVLTQTKTETIEGQGHDHSVNSKINLVDLAGSERQSQANTSGDRLREGANINKSLLTLGKVISLLAERSDLNKKRKIFIPYRDSVLTWLLKESLGGNSKTAMIATISPSSQHLEETLSTLRYAHQARSIVNRVHINEDPKAKIIRQLRAEIERLRGEQGGGGMNEEALAASMSEISRLKSEMEEMSRSWQERLRQAEARKAEELKMLERAGVTFKVDNRLPNLVNLNEDPQLSEMLLYVIKEGETRVGRDIDDSRHIKLTGALIADKHCVINSQGGNVQITPLGEAPTYVNGNLISDTTVLHHADRVILGGDHYFRFNHPMEVQKNKASESREIKDFDFARQELLGVQEARLQAELEAVMEKTRQELDEQKDGYESKLKGLEKVLTKVEETHKEAQSTIHSLQKQNMMLEQEVLAGRKRHKLESSLSQQSIEALSLSKSKIVELLEAETKKVAARLDKFRSKRSELAAAPLGSSSVVSLLSSSSSSCDTTRDGGGEQQQQQLSTPSRRDLYKIALLVREANKINQYLNTSLVFSREDVSDEEGPADQVLRTQIRVTNTRHCMFTLWTVGKFEEKLTQMRDLFQNEGDKSADDDEIFNDPDDIWETEQAVSSPACNGMNGPRSTPKLPSLARTTPLMMFQKASAGSLSSPRSGHEVDVVRACKEVLSSVSDYLTGNIAQWTLSFEESLMDKVLSTCQRIRFGAETVLDREGKKFTHGPGETTWVRPMLQLVADVPLLASHVALWSSFFDGLNLPFLRDLLAGAADQVKVVGHQATSLLQGCDGCLSSLMKESGEKLTTAVLSLCVTCGELALATDSSVLRIDQSPRDQDACRLSAEISEHFLQGCAKFARQTLSGGVSALEDFQRRASYWSNGTDGTDTEPGELGERLSHVLACTQELLHRTLASLESLVETFSGLNKEERPVQQYSATYKLLQGLVSSVGSVVDSSTLLVESVAATVQ
ncbi:kinesin-like protein KIF14, partial [Elysia marginata]